MSNTGNIHHQPHVALFPSAGMGHLIPFLRFAARLLHHPCRLTLITVHPTVSHAESEFTSRFLSAFPQVTHKLFHLLPFDPSTANSTDPFWLRFEAIRRSAHLLTPLLSSLSPPLSAIVSDISLISSVLPVSEGLRLPHYILSPSSARMFCLFAYLPISVTSDQISDVLEIPGIPPMPKSSLPPLLLDPNSLMTALFLEDGKKAAKLNGVFLNTFEGIEGEALDALNGSKIVKGMPPVIPIGPFVPCEFERGENDGAILRWLDDQPAAKSVVYFSFGSRTAASRDQIREIGNGLVRSGFKFIWVVKEKVVDKEEEVGLGEILGEELMERVKDKGLVMKEFVNQEGILGHRAVGGFVSHCGWNSVMEAAWHGVPLLAWAAHGDQKVNAEVMERIGLGIWVRSWGWGRGEEVVKGEEIGEKIREIMGSERLRVEATQIREEARKVAGVGGSCESKLKGLIEEWKKKKSGSF